MDTTRCLGLSILIACLIGGLHCEVSEIPKTSRPASGTAKVGEASFRTLKCTVGQTGDDPYDNLVTLTWKKGKDTICSVVAATKETCADGGTDGFAAIYTTEGEGNQHNLKFVDSVTMTYALAGNYTCDVEITGVGSKSYPAELTVVGDVTFAADSTKIGKGQDTNITFTAKYKGVKPTVVITEQNGDALSNTHVTDEPSGTEKIITVTAKITGTAEGTPQVYECAVEGLAAQPSAVTVTVVENVVETEPSNVVSLVDGAPVLECILKTDKNTTPLSWYFEGGEVCKGGTDPCTNTDYELVADTKYNLKVKKATIESGGKYECKVTVSSTVIPYPAELSVYGKTNCSKEGDKAKCFVETGGKIPPTIKWKVGADVKDGTLDDTKTMSTIALEDKSKQYTCQLMSGTKVLDSCVGHNTASGLGSKLYQSTLLSAVVLWLCYRMV